MSDPTDAPMDVVDLESLAAGYAHRPASTDSLARAVAAWRASGGRAGEAAVDVGGGMGLHAEQWARAGALAVVIDPSERMVLEAASRPGVAAIRGRAEALPLSDGSAALVMFQWSLHYTELRLALREAARVLRVGGRVEVATPRSTDVAKSHMAQWFPAMVPIDVERFPEPDDVATALVAAGLEVIGREPVVEKKRRRAADWVAAVEAGFVSTLQLISDADRATGLERFRAQHPDPGEIVRYDVRYERLAATVPR